MSSYTLTSSGPQMNPDRDNGSPMRGFFSLSTGRARVGWFTHILQEMDVSGQGTEPLELGEEELVIGKWPDFLSQYGALTPLEDLVGHIVEILNRYYAVGNTLDVYNFIYSNPEVASHLINAPATFRDYFPSAELSLWVDFDPDLPNRRQLVLTIRTDKEPVEAVDLMDRLDYEWLLDKPNTFRRVISIQLEFE